MAKSKNAAPYPTTPDGHYFVVRERLWRCTNPHLSESVRADATRTLMAARRQLANKQLSEKERRVARERVQAAKETLGERGDVWWSDGGPVCDRKLIKNTPYGAWWAARSAKAPWVQK